MDCKLVRSHLDAYVDAELEPTPVIEFERHLDDCTNCRNELALSRLMQRGVRELALPAAPHALKLRLTRALDEADAREGRGGFPLRNPWAMSVLTGAASLVFLVGGLIRSDSRGNPAQQTEAGLVDPFGVLGEVVQRHVDQLPSDINAEPPEQVTSWFRGKVDFRMRPVEFNEPQVHFLGARVSHVQDRTAANLYYSVGSSRLTTVVFQPSKSFQHVLHDDHQLQRWGVHRERLGNRVVTYNSVHGYTVPVFEHDGVVYAFTGDLDQQRLLKLVASARLP
jgi:anti-sigma factor RsiW